MKFIHEKMTFIHMKSFIYGCIHPCKWIEITLNFNFKLKFKFFSKEWNIQNIFQYPKLPFTIDACEHSNISMTFNPYNMISNNMNFHPSNSHRFKSCEPMPMVCHVLWCTTVYILTISITRKLINDGHICMCK